MKTTVSFIGAGKVAQSLGRALYDAGYIIDCFISPSKLKGKRVADSLNAEWTDQNSMKIDSRLVIVSVPDSALSNVVAQLNVSSDTVVVHTAGSYGLEVMNGLVCEGKGVFYPLQTFTEGRSVNINTVPFLIEADSADTANWLISVAGTLSDVVYEVDTPRRRLLHLAAVFVCNFVNHLYGAGESIVKETGLPFSIMDPLIKETLMKAMEMGPVRAQTGPASRNDTTTIEMHLDLLSFYPDLVDIYESLTRSILNNKLSDKYE